jgi:hypothetical protein
MLTFPNLYNLKLSRRLNSIKSSRAHSRVNWLQVETNVIVPETLVCTCNQLKRLCAREDFIEFTNLFKVRFKS